MADCKRLGAEPERISHCTPSGCNEGAFWFGCACVPSDAGDAVLAIVGALNALSGWTTASAAWLMLVARLPCKSFTGNAKAATLLPLGSIVFAGLSAVLISIALGCSPAGCVSRARGIVVDSGQLTAGLEGLAVWLAMLPGSKAHMQNSISCIVLWAFTGFIHLGLVAMALHGSMGSLMALGAEQLSRFCLARLWPLLTTALAFCLMVSAMGCAYTHFGLKSHCSLLEGRIHRVLEML